MILVQDKSLSAAAVQERTTPPWVIRLTNHVPPGQFVRYLVVGGINTAFGYVTFALLTALLTPIISGSYVVASVISNLVNITFSYCNYKFFVFKTKGNYVREWLRCVTVYGSGIAVGAVLLPILVFLLRRFGHLITSAPYLAGGILTIAGVFYSFLGHRRFSFRVTSTSIKSGESLSR